MDSETFLALPSIDRLRHYDDQLVSYREAGSEDGVRTRTQLVRNVLGRLRGEHASLPLTPADVERINQEMTLELPSSMPEKRFLLRKLDECSLRGAQS